MVVQNMDVAMLLHKFRRFNEEIVKSASSAANALREADKGRFLTYIADIRRLIIHFNNQPELDLPEWTPTDIAVPDFETQPQPENEALLHMSNIVSAAWFEAANSQSARQGAGLITHDAVRVNAIVDKLEKFLAEYVDSQLPLDYPESSPTRTGTGPGRISLK